MRRLWISSLTPEAIREGFDALRDGSSMRPSRTRAQPQRVGLDRGHECHRVRFGRPGNVLSVGRVQTPTLRLIVNREKEIEDFKPEKFWTVHARFACEGVTYDGVWFKKSRTASKRKKRRRRSPRSAAAQAS